MVVLDSSVLLGFYQYPEATLDEFFEVLARLGDRLWIPYQVGVEFQQAREGRLPERRTVLLEVRKRIGEIGGSLNRLGLPEYHPVLDMAEFESRRKAAEEAVENLAAQVGSALASIPDSTPEEYVQDDLFDRITNLFDGRVGDSFTPDELQKLHEEGARRYQRQIPPGYKDSDKEDPRRYGDLVVWKQILRRATASNGKPASPTILVTADRKADWWRRRGEAFVGPRTELIREYLDVVHETFFMYRPDQFLSDART